MLTGLLATFAISDSVHPMSVSEHVLPHSSWRQRCLRMWYSTAAVPDVHRKGSGKSKYSVDDAQQPLYLHTRHFALLRSRVCADKCYTMPACRPDHSKMFLCCRQQYVYSAWLWSGTQKIIEHRFFFRRNAQVYKLGS